MATFQNVIDNARVDLQDSGKTRYPDTELLGFANDGLQEMYRYRPDFLFGKYTTITTVYVASDEVPVTAKYVMLLQFYVAFRAEIRDDEYAVNGRAAGFLGRFEKELKS